MPLLFGTKAAPGSIYPIAASYSPATTAQRITIPLLAAIRLAALIFTTIRARLHTEAWPFLAALGRSIFITMAAQPLPEILAGVGATAVFI